MAFAPVAPAVSFMVFVCSVRRRLAAVFANRQLVLVNVNVLVPAVPYRTASRAFLVGRPRFSLVWAVPWTINTLLPYWILRGDAAVFCLLHLKDAS